MGLVKHASLLVVFVGGCLSGAALLQLQGAGQRSAETAPVPALLEQQRELPEQVVPAPIEQERVVEAPSPRLVRTDAEPEEARDESRSAGEVLAYLEAAYQEGLATTRSDPEPELEEQPSDGPDEPPTSDSDEQPSDQAEIMVRSEESDALVDNEVAVVLNQTDTHESAAHHGDLVLGDKVAGSKVEGDVHLGDVNQVQQVALVYQPVFVVPTGVQPSGPRARAKTTPRQRVNPFASVTISPKHNPWKTMLAEPGNPWSSVGPLDR